MGTLKTTPLTVSSNNCVRSYAASVYLLSSPLRPESKFISTDQSELHAFDFRPPDEIDLSGCGRTI